MSSWINNCLIHIILASCMSHFGITMTMVSEDVEIVTEKSQEFGLRGKGTFYYCFL